MRSAQALMAQPCRDATNAILFQGRIVDPRV